jgi:site-specific DNA-methyltransferase (adenine-specific)
MSVRQDWKTPKALYQTLDAEFCFDFDPCPSKSDFDGLSVEWGETNFVNPPYGTQIHKWIAKGFAEWQKGKTVVFLIPSRTDTRYWHDYVMKADEIRFIKGRLCFDAGKGQAPFPSAIVVFHGKRIKTL